MSRRKNPFTICALLIGLCVCLMIMVAIGGSTYTYTGAQTQSSAHWTNPSCVAVAGTQLNMYTAVISCTVDRTQDLPSTSDNFGFTAVVTADATGMGNSGVVDSGVGLGVSDGNKYMRVHLIKDGGTAKVALIMDGFPDTSLSIGADWTSGPVIVQLFRDGPTVGIKVGIEQRTESYDNMDDDDPLYIPMYVVKWFRTFLLIS